MKRVGGGIERSAMIAAVVMCLVLMPLVSYGENKYWVGGTSGWWDEITNWNPSGQPQAGDNAYLTQSDGIDRTVDYRSTLDPAPLLWDLRIDATGSGTIAFFQTLYSLSTEAEVVGVSGNATFDQSGGTNTAYGLYVGFQSGSTGTYNLSGSGTLSAASENIGHFGTGTFNQSGATNTVTDLLSVGDRLGSVGVYNLSNTGVLSANGAVIGHSGTGTFTQTGGTNAMTRGISVGNRAGSTGTYNLSGTGTLSAASETIGVSGTGTFNQSAGTNTVTGGLSVGTGAGSTGTYSLSGTGALSAASEYVGSNGTGTFNQSAGTNTMTGRLFVGSYSGSTGTYNLSDTGALSAGSDEYIGYAGTGIFAQSGGTHTIAGVLNVGNNSGSMGTYNLSGTGVLSDWDEVIGRSGSGTFNQTSGTNTMTSNGLYLGYEAGGTGTYNLSDGALSSVREEVIGQLGAGTFTQTGGTNEMRELTVGGGHGATGAYTLSGGDLRVASWELVANFGVGTFDQTGGTNTITGGLHVGNESAGTGTYNLSGTGVLSAETETIGNFGIATFTQTGGTNTTNTLTIRADPTGSSVYNLDGGTLNATTIVNNDRFNYSGGDLNGNFTNSAGATFALSGAGTRTVNGDVTNDGTIKVTGATEGTTAVFTGTFINNGILYSDPTRLEFLGDVLITPGGSIYASPGDRYVFHEDLIISTSIAGDLFTDDVELVFVGLGSHVLSLNGLDLSANELSLEDGATLDLDGGGSLYASVVSGLVFDSDGSVANVSASADFTLFYDPALSPDLSGTYHALGGGIITPVGMVPLPGALCLETLGLMGLIITRRRLRASRVLLSTGTRD